MKRRRRHPDRGVHQTVDRPGRCRYGAPVRGKAVGDGLEALQGGTVEHRPKNSTAPLPRSRGVSAATVVSIAWCLLLGKAEGEGGGRWRGAAAGQVTTTVRVSRGVGSARAMDEGDEANNSLNHGHETEGMGGRRDHRGAKRDRGGEEPPPGGVPAPSSLYCSDIASS